MDGKLLQQMPTPDLQRLELKVDDRGDALKVTLAREADGIAVEVRAPREVVAELRALRPEVDAALADEGYDLTAYDADEDLAGGASDEDDLDFGGDEPSPDAPASAEGRSGTPVDAYGDGHLFNRRA